ncbi:MAG: glycosyltransferase [Mucilaginibacter sp.]
MATDKLKIAALASSFNRLKKTSAFLSSLLSQQVPDNYLLDVYLLDDKSTDGTADYVRKNFSTVTVVYGTGSLFWAGSMRTLWDHAKAAASYDLFLLLNDDVELFDDAIVNLIAAYNKRPQSPAVIIGTVRGFTEDEITYGGRKLTSRTTGDSKLVTPDKTELKECELGNANIMLVDKGTVDKIGVLSAQFTHGGADYDYTMRAVEAGIKVYVAPGFYGYCENDHGLPWLSSEHSLKERIKYLYSPKGLAYKEYLFYIRKHFPLMYPIIVFKLWCKTLLPVIFDRYKKNF